MNKTPFLLPVWFHNTKTMAMTARGEACIGKDYDTRIVHFYNIEAVVPYDIGENRHSKVWISGDWFLCEYSPEQIQDVIFKE